jgi:PhnB protein
MNFAHTISRRQFLTSAVAMGVFTAYPALAAAENNTSTKGPSMTTLTPYLLLDGNCREAMEFYHSCLGGELNLTLVKDSPAAAQMPAFQHNKVLNAHLMAGPMQISASDWLALNETPMRGNTVCLFVNGGSPAELKALFDKLSPGAQVTNPLKEVFFGMYGALNDRFGVRWMFQTRQSS